MTVWSMLQDCVAELDEPLRRSEIVGWFRRHRPEVNEATLAAHIQAATENAANRAQHSALGSRPALVRRVDHGLYVRAARLEPAVTPVLGDLAELDQPAVAEVRAVLQDGRSGTLAAALDRELAMGRAITPVAAPLGRPRSIMIDRRWAML